MASFDPEFQSVLRNNVLPDGGGRQILGLAKDMPPESWEQLS